MNTSETKSSSASPAGAVIVLDQTPDSEKVADFCWRSATRDDTSMLFPATVSDWHLPVPGQQDRQSQKLKFCCDILTC